MMRAGIRGTPIPVVPGKGSTEDLENKSLQTFEHPKSAPIQTGVASLWTKAENISRVAKEGTGPTGNGSVKELLGRGRSSKDWQRFPARKVEQVFSTHYLFWGKRGGEDRSRA